jgi:hypothetical protein
MGWYGNAIMYHTWGGYYTTSAHIVVIRSDRTIYRATPAYTQQRVNTHQYYSQAYHGTPVTVRPGTSIGTGVTVKPGAVAPAHVSQPAAYTPPKAGPTNTFNRPNTAPPSAVTPGRATGTTNTFVRPTGPALDQRPGGLFNSHTYGGNSGAARSAPSAPRSSGGGGRHR